MMIVHINGRDYATDTPKALEVVYAKMAEHGIEAALLWEVTFDDDGVEIRRVPTDDYVKSPSVSP